MLNAIQTKYTKAFFASAEKVLASELNIPFIKRSSSLKNSTKPSYPCCVSIGFFAEKILTGQVVYAMSNEFANYIVQGMLPDTDAGEQKRLQNSCIGELGNMISGRATKEISNGKRPMTITPPTVFYAQDSNMSIDFVELSTIVLILDSEFGPLEINIGLKERNT